MSKRLFTASFPTASSRFGLNVTGPVYGFENLCLNDEFIELIYVFVFEALILYPYCYP